MEFDPFHKVAQSLCWSEWCTVHIGLNAGREACQEGGGWGWGVGSGVGVGGVGGGVGGVGGGGAHG